jgi:poly(beta-D-mannuronate) lyase
LYEERDGALHRLINFCVAGLEDPTLLQKKTGVPQVIPHPLTGLEIGWAVPYVRRFPDPRISSLLSSAQWTRFWQWGGSPPN